MGIVGCGVISHVHLQALKKIDDCKIVCVCDLDKDKASNVAETYNIPNVYQNLSDMLKREKLDMVEVLTNPQSHASLCVQALEAGVNVLVEKPMCINLREADQMIETAKNSKVKLGVIHSFLFIPAIQDALNVVKKAKTGDLLRADVTVSLNWIGGTQPTWMHKLPGGLFGEIIPHGFYLLLAFTGRVSDVHCMIRGHKDSSGLIPFSDLHALVRGENAIGGLFVSTDVRSPYTVMSVSAITTDRVLFVNVPTATLIQSNTQSSTGLLGRAHSNLNVASQYLSRSFGLGLKAVTGKVKPHMTHKIVIEGFINSIRNNSEPLVTAEDGREVVKVSNMIWEQVL